MEEKQLPQEGLAAFGDDPGSLWINEREQVSVAEGGGWWNARRLRKVAGPRLIVWIVDDESAQRSWFRNAHGVHFAVVTFSSKKHCQSAIDRRIPCDAVATAIFFPSDPPRDGDAANRLRRIYSRIASRPNGKLPDLWKELKHEKEWILDGFEIAAAAAEYRGGDVPVFLYSLKAPVLLDVEEIAAHGTEPNVYWLPIKPRATSDPALIVVKGQREKITKAVREQRDVRFARRFWKILRAVFGLGRVSA